MKHLYRQYRQVKISRRGSQKPQVQGYEETWRDGEKQVRHWTDSEQLDLLSGETPDLFDSWLTPESEFGLPMAEPEIETEFDSFTPFPRYIKPIKVEVQEPVTRKWVLGEELSKVKQFFVLVWQKVQRMSQRLPSAFKAAWRELNSVDENANARKLDRGFRD